MPAAEPTEPAAPAAPAAEAKTAGDAKKKTAKQRVAAARTAKAETAAKTPASRDELWVPPIARKMAFLAFALSGASALCYEVVWSRALAMTIGSSIYSFSLILETFLIGIAGGAAAMSALMARGRAPLGGIGVVASLLTLLSMTPWAIDIQVAGGRTHSGDLMTWILVSALPIVLIGLVALYGIRRAEQEAQLVEVAGAKGVTPASDPFAAPSLIMLSVPVTCAVLNAGYFSAGYLPKILASVVASVAVILGVAVTLRRHPVLLLALVQMFIAIATTVSYVWQDEIPYAFAQLVVSIDDLPDHVGTVQFFMFITASLVSLPATLGMGAMFPLTIRAWTAGGQGIARDVAVVYTGNTIGSIVGSWLPGFVLLPLIGMERTLHVGIALNMLLALGMLIAGAAEPEAAADAKAAAPGRASRQRQRLVGAGVAIAIGIVGSAVVSLTAHDTAVRNGAFLGVGAIVFLVFALWMLLASTDTDRADTPPPATESGKPRELPTWHAVTVYILSPAHPGAARAALPRHRAPRLDHALEPLPDDARRVPRLARGGHARPRRRGASPTSSTTTTASRPRSPSSAGAATSRSRTTARSTPRTATTCRRRSWSRPIRCCCTRAARTDLDVAVVGFGSGVTVGTALSFPVRSVDVDRARARDPRGRALLRGREPPRLPARATSPTCRWTALAVINDDGRNFLASTRSQVRRDHQRAVEPVDHGRLATCSRSTTSASPSDALRPGGVYCQWVQLYEMSPENIKTIYRTFASQFRYVVRARGRRPARATPSCSAPTRRSRSTSSACGACSRSSRSTS